MLLLDGKTFAVDQAGKLWVRFDVKPVAISVQRPHGLKYSLTLHDEDGGRILGFDNAHPIKEGTGPGAHTRVEYDHTHKGERLRFDRYADAATLLSDFWQEVESIMRERNL